MFSITGREGPKGHEDYLTFSWAFRVRPDVASTVRTADTPGAEGSAVGEAGGEAATATAPTPLQQRTATLAGGRRRTKRPVSLTARDLHGAQRRRRPQSAAMSTKAVSTTGHQSAGHGPDAMLDRMPGTARPRTRTATTPRASSKRRTRNPSRESARTSGIALPRTRPSDGSAAPLKCRSTALAGASGHCVDWAAEPAPNESSLVVKQFFVWSSWSGGLLARRRRGFVVVALVRVREWLSRRAGVSGCEPAALATETFPGCPPGPAVRGDGAVAAARRASATMATQRASLMRRLRARRASFFVLPSAILRS